MRKICLLSSIFLLVLHNSLNISASSPVQITALRPVIFLVSANPNARIRVSISIKIENSTDNRTISLRCEPQSELGNAISAELDYLSEPNDPKFSTISEYYFWGKDGITLPRGEYILTAILTRNVKGERKEFASSATIKIGVEDKEDR